MKLVICAVFIVLRISYGKKAADTTDCTLNCNNILNPVCATSKDTEITVFANVCALNYKKCSMIDKEYEELDIEVCKEHLKQQQKDHYRSCILHLEGYDMSEKGELKCEVNTKKKPILVSGTQIQ